MGLFDTIRFKAKLPDDAPDFVKKSPVFQTYDLGRGMGEYEVDQDGKLIMTDLLIGVMLGVKPQSAHIQFNGKVDIYATNLRGGAPRGGAYVYFTESGEDYETVEYRVRFKKGVLVKIAELRRNSQPARPVAEM